MAMVIFIHIFVIFVFWCTIDNMDLHGLHIVHYLVDLLVAIILVLDAILQSIVVDEGRVLFVWISEKGDGVRLIIFEELSAWARVSSLQVLFLDYWSFGSKTAIINLLIRNCSITGSQDSATFKVFQLRSNWALNAATCKTIAVLAELCCILLRLWRLSRRVTHDFAWLLAPGLLQEGLNFALLLRVARW